MTMFKIKSRIKLKPITITESKTIKMKIKNVSRSLKKTPTRSIYILIYNLYVGYNLRKNNTGTLKKLQIKMHSCLNLGNYQSVVVLY